jgi:voltage-gated potassium channel Kch
MAIGRLEAGRIAQLALEGASALAAVYVVDADGRVLTSATNAGRGEQSCFATTRTLAEDAVRCQADIRMLVGARVMDWPGPSDVTPRLEGAALCIYGSPGDEVVLGAASLIGVDAARARALLRDAIVAQGFHASRSMAEEAPLA